MAKSSYTEFSVEKYLAPTAVRKPVRIEGLAKVKEIYDSRSTSTEEFVAGAISSLGYADRCVMYVNQMNKGLSERLNLATEVAKRVNFARRQGMEGFENARPMDPWAYAIEGKAGDFFKKIWDAICTAFRKVVEAIANFLKWIGNYIGGKLAKTASQDYEKFKKMGCPTKNGGDRKVTSLNYKLKFGELSNSLKSLATQYTAVFGDTDADKLIKALGNGSVSPGTKFMDTVAKLLNISWSGTGNTPIGRQIQAKFRAKLASLDASFERSKVSLFGEKAGSTAHAAVMAKFAGDGKATEHTAKSVYDMCGSWEICSKEFLASHITKVVSSVSSEQKKMAEYIKRIDTLARNFGKLSDMSDKGDLKAISKSCASIASKRAAINSYFTSVAIEMESMALRYRRSVHMAMKIFMKANDPKKYAGSSEESFSNQMSVDDLFDFR